MKKIIGILFCMMLVIPVFPISVTADDEPKLELEIKFRIKNLTIIVRNVGDGDAYDVIWSFDIEGGFFHFVNYHIGSSIDILPAGNETRVENSFLLFGFGLIEMTITIGASNVETTTETRRGFIFGLFINIIL